MSLRSPIFAYSVAQRSIRVSARELRVALRHAPEGLRADIEATLERLQQHDEACDLELERVAEPDEIFDETAGTPEGND